MSSSFYEKLAYDSEHAEDFGFYVAVKNRNNKEVSRKPLSAWGLTKELTTSLIVRTEKPNLGNLEQPFLPELYEVQLTYSVNKSAKSLFLKKETQQNDNNDVVVSKIFLRDVDNGSTQPLPIPNENYRDEFDIEIKKSKGKLINIKESVALLKSGNCLGIFDSSLTKCFML